MEWSTSSIPIWRAASCPGSTWIRTAYFIDPNTATWATPGTIEICWPSRVSAYPSTMESGRVLEVRGGEWGGRGVGRGGGRGGGGGFLLPERGRARHVRGQLIGGGSDGRLHVE